MPGAEFLQGTLRIEYTNLPIRTPCACKRDARRVFETNFPSLPSAWQGRVASSGPARPPPCAQFPLITHILDSTLEYCTSYTRRHARLPLPESANDEKFLLEGQGWILLAPKVFCTGRSLYVLSSFVNSVVVLEYCCSEFCALPRTSRLTIFVPYSSTWRTYLI